MIFFKHAGKKYRAAGCTDSDGGESSSTKNLNVSDPNSHHRLGSPPGISVNPHIHIMITLLYKSSCYGFIR